MENIKIFIEELIKAPYFWCALVIISVGLYGAYKLEKEEKKKELKKKKLRELETRYNEFKKEA